MSISDISRNWDILTVSRRSFKKDLNWQKFCKHVRADFYFLFYGLTLYQTQHWIGFSLLSDIVKCDFIIQRLRCLIWFNLSTYIIMLFGQYLKTDQAMMAGAQRWVMDETNNPRFFFPLPSAIRKKVRKLELGNRPGLGKTIFLFLHYQWDIMWTCVLLSCLNFYFFLSNGQGALVPQCLWRTPTIIHLGL